jgi:hypothetical protein
MFITCISKTSQSGHGAKERLWLLNINTIGYIRKGEEVWDKGLGFGDEPINTRDKVSSVARTSVQEGIMPALTPSY